MPTQYPVANDLGFKVLLTLCKETLNFGHSTLRINQSPSALLPPVTFISYSHKSLNNLMFL